MRIRVFALTLLLTGVVVEAQQPAPATAGRGVGRARTAPPGINWPSPPLPDGPIVLDTAIQHQIRLTVTKGLVHPFSMAFLPDGTILVTERPGRLRIVRNGVLDPTPIAGLPQIRAQGLGGLMDLALDPRFDENKLIYFTYDEPAATGNTASQNAGAGSMGRNGTGGSARFIFRDSERQCIADSFRTRRDDLHDDRRG